MADAIVKTFNPLDEELLNILQGVMTNASSAKDFLVEQTPEVVQQLLLWNATESLIEMLIGLSIFYVMYYFYKNIGIGQGKVIDNTSRLQYKWTLTHNNKGNIDGHFVAISFMSLILSIMGIAFINTTWLKIWIAPKLYLMEYITSMLK